MSITRFAKFAWFVLAFNISVILWGAYVRASGSGAGCGSHWPLCNGVVIPRSPALETIIEFIHRLSSGLALVLIVVMFLWAVRGYPKDHIVRKGAMFSMIFIFIEAIVGAGLVLFSWVAKDESLGRVIAMAIHLINTFLLLASLSLTAWLASGRERLKLIKEEPLVWIFGIAFLLVLLLGVSGAIAALGDTLFPSSTLQKGFSQDFSPTAHFLIRLRVLHPLIAILTGIYVISLAVSLALMKEDRMVKRVAAAVCTLTILQLIAGLVNLVLLAPIIMQLVHLLLADLVWISLVLLGASSFSKSLVTNVIKDVRSLEPSINTQSVNLRD